MSEKIDKEEMFGPWEDDPGGAEGGGSRQAPTLWSTKGGDGGCSTRDSPSRAGSRSGAGRTPPVVKPHKEGKGTPNIRLVHFDTETSQDFDLNDQALKGIKMLEKPKNVTGRSGGTLGAYPG